MRLTLERAVIRLACQGLEEEKIQGLEKNVKLQRFYLENNEVSELLKLDNQFHKELFTITNKSHIYRLMSNMILHFDRLRTLRTKTVDQMYVIDDHMNILDAIRMKNPDKGEKAMEQHLTKHEIDKEIIHKKYPQYFKDN